MVDAAGQRGHVVGLDGGEHGDAEPGTELHIIHQAKDNPDVVFFYELYTDEAAYKSHGEGDALKSVLPKLGGLVAAPPDMIIATPRHAKGITP